MQPKERWHASQNRDDPQKNKQKFNLHGWRNWSDRKEEFAKRIILVVFDIKK